MSQALKKDIAAKVLPAGMRQASTVTQFPIIGATFPAQTLEACALDVSEARVDRESH
ncbi:hypothetical protein [Streptomyces lavendulae]|uniref:hypothetical protein n=1 Tax=Streptomyces lavendulae TaxID=1914 RepID=UPI003405CF17